MKKTIPVLLLLSACASPQTIGPASVDTRKPTIQTVSEAPTETVQADGYSSRDPVLLLLNTPETFDVLQKHIPFFVNLTEHGIIPPIPLTMTLDDLLNAPETKVTAENIRAINADLARLR